MVVDLTDEEKQWIAVALRYAHYDDGPLESIPAQVMAALERKFPQGDTASAAPVS